MEEQRTVIEIPVGYVSDKETGVCLFNTDETDKVLFSKLGIVVQEDTIEGARKAYLSILNGHIKWLEKRSCELDKWKPFQKGDWSHIGGTWFTVFGFHFYFRYGKGMKGGRYVPFTKLNIGITNYWRRKMIKN